VSERSPTAEMIDGWELNAWDGDWSPTANKGDVWLSWNNGDIEVEMNDDRIQRVYVSLPVMKRFIEMCEVWAFRERLRAAQPRDRSDRE
jgi:hypothetical protein